MAIMALALEMNGPKTAYNSNEAEDYQHVLLATIDLFIIIFILTQASNVSVAVVR
jgi:hypothetical protein